MLTRLRMLTAGESHGPMLTGILDGMPAGLLLDREDLLAQMKRRQHGHGRSARMQLEPDEPTLVGGVRHGRTTGAPIAMLVHNRDHARWGDVMSVWPPTTTPAKVTVPRPGHADLAGLWKFGHDDVRDVLERASARETTMRVALASVCRQLLRDVGVEVGSSVVQIGTAHASSSAPSSRDELVALRARADASPVRCVDDDAGARMVAAVDAALHAGDTLGGTFVVHVVGLPAGLGTYTQWDRRLSARLSFALSSIHAIKSVEIGAGAAVGGMPGSQAHDAVVVTDAGLARASAHSGGLEGGMSTGETLVVRAAMKPLSTVPGGLPTVDLATGAPARGHVERSDVCAVPAAAVVSEAMVCLALCDALLEKFGGDSMDELRAHLRTSARFPR